MENIEFKTPKETIKVCELENGERIFYDVCDKTGDYYNPEYFELIGKGKIYSIDGVVQKGYCEGHYFYKRSK